MRILDTSLKRSEYAAGDAQHVLHKSLQSNVFDSEEKRMTIQISFFSGTGCTEYVAHAFAKEFQERGHTAICKNLVKDSSIDGNLDLLVVCFVVHACNAPEPVMNWVSNLERSDGKPVVIISVSGGGEVTPNLACRVPIKRALRRKNYRVMYEKMLVMPSNWIVETRRVLSSKLLQVLPYKVSHIVSEVINGTTRFTHPLIGNRLLTLFGSLEHIGAHAFGKNIHADASCNGCGLCAIKCPVSNIALQDNKPAFGKKCVLCLGCIYSCPQKALRPAIMKFVAIPNGFSLKDILALPHDDTEIDLDREAKGYLWLGVKRYLSNTSDMLEPALNKGRQPTTASTYRE